MIVWINGPFGVGKTTTATRLAALVPGATIYDPERYGGVLQRTVGLWRRGDFQDLPLWRSGTVRGAARRDRGDAVVLVPMSVLDTRYQEEILGGLRRRGRDVLHVTLHASSPVLRRRIEEDTVDTGALPWRTRQLARYEEAAAALAGLGAIVDTDGLDADAVTARVQGLVRAWVEAP